MSIEGHKLLHIRSVDRITAANSPNSFTINVPSSVPHKIAKFQLLGYIFPNSAYNVNTTNTTFYITQTDGTPSTATITLTQANYTGTTLATQIQTKLQASTLTNNTLFTCVYDSTTNKITIAVSGGHTFQIDFSNAETSMESYLLMGFVKNSTTADGATITSTNQIDLSGLRHVVIDIDGFDNSEFISTSASRGQIYIPLAQTDAGVHVMQFDKNSLTEFEDTQKHGSRTWAIKVYYNGVVAPILAEWEMVIKLLYDV